MLDLRIKKKKKIRCADCLTWNNKEDKFCRECSAQLVPAHSFGAAVCILSTGQYKREKLKKYLRKEDNEKVLYWNELFREQLDHMTVLTSGYPDISSNFLLDLKEDIEKSVLVNVPMKPEGFKPFRDFKLPDEKLPHDQKLEYLFRSHPLWLFRYLAAMALVHSGKASKEVCSALLEWHPDTIKLHQERLLALCHWSATMYFEPYETKDILPLHDKSREISWWAKLYLYKAKYKKEELKPQLEAILQEGPKHLALSCAVALKQFSKIKEILGDTIHEDTLALQVQYADVSQVPMLLSFLAKALQDDVKKIIDKCCALSKESKKDKEAIVQWLLAQNRAELFEGLFLWKEIPELLDIVDHLLGIPEGLDVLSRKLLLWMRQEEPSPPDALAKHIVQIEEDNIQEENRATFERMRTAFFELYFYSVCEEARSNPNEARINQLLSYLFSSEPELPTRLADRCFAVLYYLAGQKNSLGELYFSLVNKNIEKVSPDVITFLKKMREYLQDDETNHNCDEWIEEVLKEQSKMEVAFYDPQTLADFFQLMLDLAIRDKLRSYTQCTMLELISKNREVLQKFPNLKNGLDRLKKYTGDQNVLNWLSRVEEA